MSPHEHKIINAILDSIKNRVYELQRQIIHDRLEFNISNFKNKWLGIADRPRKILEIFRHHNDQMKKLVELGEVAAGTLERYETALTHLSNFIKGKFKINDYNIKDLNYEFAADFDFWLKTVRRCCHNSSIKYVSQRKKMAFNLHPGPDCIIFELLEFSTCAEAPMLNRKLIQIRNLI